MTIENLPEQAYRPSMGSDAVHRRDTVRTANPLVAAQLERNGVRRILHVEHGHARLSCRHVVPRPGARVGRFTHCEQCRALPEARSVS